MGVFLVGAYQEILGDLHNLFGDTNAVHIKVKGNEYVIDKIIEGETVADVLEYVQFSPKKMARTVEVWVTTSVKKGIIRPKKEGNFYPITVPDYTVTLIWNKYHTILFRSLSILLKCIAFQ